MLKETVGQQPYGVKEDWNNKHPVRSGAPILLPRKLYSMSWFYIWYIYIYTWSYKFYIYMKLMHITKRMMSYWQQRIFQNGVSTECLFSLAARFHRIKSEACHVWCLRNALLNNCLQCGGFYSFDMSRFFFQSNIGSNNETLPTDSTQLSVTGCYVLAKFHSSKKCDLKSAKNH